jgi:hypothetical protein
MSDADDLLAAVDLARVGRTDAEADFVAAIVRAHAGGASYRMIAERADLTFQRVAQIVKANRYPADAVSPAG